MEVDYTAGLAAVGALVTMPRLFFHAHLADLDVPAAVSVFGTVFVFWRTKENPSLKADLALGIARGLALAIKINAVFVLPILLLWMLAFFRRAYLFRRLISMGATGPLLFLAIWPCLYHQFWPRLIEHILFVTVDHWKIGQFYLGQFYMRPPWHFPFVMILTVVPLSVTLLYVWGSWHVWTIRRLRVLGGLLVLCALVLLITLSTRKSMVYDNGRLLMPVFNRGLKRSLCRNRL